MYFNKLSSTATVLTRDHSSSMLILKLPLNRCIHTPYPKINQKTYVLANALNQRLWVIVMLELNIWPLRPLFILVNIQNHNDDIILKWIILKGDQSFISFFQASCTYLKWPGELTSLAEAIFEAKLSSLQKQDAKIVRANLVHLSSWYIVFLTIQ